MNRVALLALLVASASAPAAVGQTGGGYDLSWHTFDVGGETGSSGGGYSLVSTTGQADAADSLSGAAYDADGGFLPGVCGSSVSPYGVGCPGTGGFVPQFDLGGCVANGYDAVVEIEQGLGGASAFLFLGLGSASLPMGGGCTLNVFPLLPTPVGPFPLTPGGPGAGSISLPITIPPTVDALVVTVTLQAFVADPTAPSGVGFSNSNGVQVTLGG